MVGGKARQLRDAKGEEGGGAVAGRVEGQGGELDEDTRAPEQSPGFDELSRWRVSRGSVPTMVGLAGRVSQSNILLLYAAFICDTSFGFCVVYSCCTPWRKKRGSVQAARQRPSHKRRKEVAQVCLHPYDPLWLRDTFVRTDCS